MINQGLIMSAHATVGTVLGACQPIHGELESLLLSQVSWLAL